jgi:hypothetical protein
MVSCYSVYQVLGPRDALRRRPRGWVLSHLVLDFVTYEGVPWFWPLDEKYSLDLGPTGGLFVGSLGFLALLLACVDLSAR